MPSWVRASLNALSCSVSTGHDALAQMDLVIDAPLEIAVETPHRDVYSP